MSKHDFHSRAGVLCALVCVLLFASCMSKEEKAARMVKDFVTAVNAKDTATVNKLYKAFLPLVPYCDSTDVALYEKPDSVVILDLSTPEQLKVARVKYPKLTEFNEFPAPKGSKALYLVFFHRDNERLIFELIDGEKGMYIAKSYNFFGEAYRREALSTEQNGLSVRYLLDAFYHADLDNIYAIQGLRNADIITRKVVAAGTLPNAELAMLYPDVSRLGAFNISGEPMSIVCTLRNTRNTETDSVDIETTVTIAQSDSGTYKTQDVSFMMGVDVERTNPNNPDPCIIDSKGLLNRQLLVSKMGEEGQQLLANGENWSDMYFLAEADKLSKKMVARAKYERWGVVLTDIGVAHGRNTAGERTTGVRFEVFNPTNRKIKYVIITALPINSVGDVMGYPSNCRGIGPVEPHRTGSWNFDELIEDPNGIIDDFKCRITVVYMDGGSKTASIAAVQPGDDFSTDLWD